MSAILEELLDEVIYHAGEIVSDPQAWSETSVQGGGFTGNRGHVSISSTSTTWTSFLIQKNDGKEYMAKLPFTFPARKGQRVIAADFRGVTIAAVNTVTDQVFSTSNVVREKLSKGSDKYRNLYKPLSSIVGSLCMIALLFSWIPFSKGAGIGIIYVLVVLVLLKLVRYPVISQDKDVETLDKALPQAACEKMKVMMA